MDYMKKKYPVESMVKVNRFLEFKYNSKTLKEMKKDYELKNHLFKLKRIIFFYANLFEGYGKQTK